MKNFFLAQAPSTSDSAFVLLHLDPNVPDELREYEPFSYYSKWLADRGYAANTVKVYSEHVARFIDYVYEASLTAFPPTLDISVSSIIHSYQSFLLQGRNSSNPIASTLAESLDKTNQTSPLSISQNIEASIRWFLEVSATRSTPTPNQLFSPFYAQLPQYRSQYEISAQTANSWLVAVVRDALTASLPKRHGMTVFPMSKQHGKKKDKDSFNSRAFPIEKAVAFFHQEKPKRSQTFYRDMCIYALLAATGARTSEILQLRFCDIDMDGSFEVFLRSPFGRSAEGLTESEHEKLAWKGRETEITFMIAPFEALYREYLEKYLALEYNSCVDHDFIFQDTSGRPYFASDRSSRLKAFKKYARQISLKNLARLSPHSLRHMYGIYVLNYMPLPGKSTPGLPMAYVRIIMGHASLDSTAKYAKHDTDIVQAYIQHANQYVTQRGDKSFTGIREEFYLRQLEIIRTEVERLG